MNRKRALTLMIVGGVIAIGAGLMLTRPWGPSNDTTSPKVPVGGAAPNPVDPAMTTESVPSIREEGVVPLPTDAVGRSPPEEPKQPQ